MPLEDIFPLEMIDGQRFSPDARDRWVEPPSFSHYYLQKCASSSRTITIYMLPEGHRSRSKLHDTVPPVSPSVIIRLLIPRRRASKNVSFNTFLENAGLFGLYARELLSRAIILATTQRYRPGRHAMRTALSSPRARHGHRRSRADACISRAIAHIYWQRAADYAVDATADGLHLRRIIWSFSLRRAQAAHIAGERAARPPQSVSGLPLPEGVILISESGFRRLCRRALFSTHCMPPPSPAGTGQAAHYHDHFAGGGAIAAFHSPHRSRHTAATIRMQTRPLHTPR